jgi:Leucine-rich repeat (LRR) protein
MRPRFTIRTLMVLSVVIAIACAWYAMKREYLQRRLQAISRLEKLTGPVSWYDGGFEFEYIYEIELEGHDIDETLWQEISMLTEARSVLLRETNVTDDDLKHLSRFWNIRQLSLSNTAVTSDGMSALSRLKTLETLNISNTSIDDGAIRSLSGLRKLTSLNVHGTKISTLGIDRLRATLPNCRIYHDASVGDPGDPP